MTGTQKHIHTGNVIWATSGTRGTGLVVVSVDTIVSVPCGAPYSHADGLPSPLRAGMGRHRRHAVRKMAAIF